MHNWYKLSFASATDIQGKAMKLASCGGVNTVEYNKKMKKCNVGKPPDGLLIILAHAAFPAEPARDASSTILAQESVRVTADRTAASLNNLFFIFCVYNSGKKEPEHYPVRKKSPQI